MSIGLAEAPEGIDDARRLIDCAQVAVDAETAD